MRLPVTMTSDFICPWCYIGKRKLLSAIERLPADVQVDISYRPFELNPDMPAEGRDRKEYRSAKPSVPMMMRHRPPGSLALRVLKDDLAHAHDPDPD